MGHILQVLPGALCTLNYISSFDSFNWVQSEKSVVLHVLTQGKVCMYVGSLSVYGVL